MRERELMDVLDREDLRLYRDAQVKRELERSSEIRREECMGLLKVEKGRLRVYITGAGGREITLFILEAEEVCIMSSPCSLGRTRMDVHIRALEDTRIKTVSPQIVDSLKKRNPDFNSALLRLMGERMSMVLDIMDDLLEKAVDVRLGEFLLGGDDVVLMTHEEIAGHLGSSREVISRILKEFQSQEAVNLGRKRIEVRDREKLKNIIKK